MVMDDNKPGLRRGLGRIDVLAFTLNTIVGAGIFALPAALAAAAGVWSLAVLGAAFALVAVIALCTAEVSSRFDATGGPVLYASEALGEFSGFVVGWLMYLSRLATFGAIATIMLDYVAGIWPLVGGPFERAIALGLFVVAVTLPNLRGVVAGAWLSNALTVAKLAPLALLALAGLALAGREFLPAAQPIEFEQLSGAFMLAFFACMGFEHATVVAGELRRPQVDLPFGMLAGLALTGVLYALLMLVCFATVPDLAGSTRPLAEAANALAGPVGATVITLTALFSCAGNLSLALLVAPRMLYAMAEQRELPRVLARVSTSGHVPAVAILVTSLAVWLLTISGTFVHLATVAVIARMLIYGSTCIALPVLRLRDGRAPLHIRGAFVMAALAIMVCAGVLATVTGEALRDVSVMLALGLALRWAIRRQPGYAESPSSSGDGS